MSHKLEAKLSNYTRIFILSGKNIPSETIASAFEEFGTIIDFRCLKDKGGIVKGITYITYSKPSEAANAIENMNGTTLPGTDRPIKVILASDKTEGNVRDPDEDYKMRRLFIIVPPMYEDNLEEYFSNFGEVISVKKLPPKKDVTLAYISFRSSYCAAKALEECDPAFKPVFAQTKSQQQQSKGDRDRPPKRPFGDGERSSDNYGYNGIKPMLSPPMVQNRHHYKPQIDTTLYVTMSPGLEGNLVNSLFNLAPGLVNCKYNKSTGEAILKYGSLDEGLHVIQRFNGFQYPPHCPITVYSHDINNEDSSVPNIQNLVHTIEKAANMLQQAGLMNNGAPGSSGGMRGRGSKGLNNYGLDLPPTQPLLSEGDADLVERLFIVTSPEQLSRDVLEDLFCRFGNLLSVTYVHGKKFGYVRYASSDSANAAIEALHQKTINGIYLKVILAEPPNNPHSLGYVGGRESVGKRKNFYDDSAYGGSKFQKFEE